MKLFNYKKYSRKELAELYGKSSRGFRTWVEPFEQEIGPRMGWDYTPAQVKIIVSHLGPPPGYILPEIVLEKK